MTRVDDDDDDDDDDDTDDGDDNDDGNDDDDDEDDDAWIHMQSCIPGFTSYIYTIYIYEVDIISCRQQTQQGQPVLFTPSSYVPQTANRLKSLC